jgi:hypothetical protein
MCALVNMNQRPPILQYYPTKKETVWVGAVETQGNDLEGNQWPEERGQSACPNNTSQTVKDFEKHIISDVRASTTAKLWVKVVLFT